MPAAFRVRCFAKVNLAFSVLGRREDGYHDIETIFQSVDLCDQLEFRSSAGLELICEDLPGLPPEDNLVWKAATSLMTAICGQRGVSITLRKIIPPGSGLGGGSSDAAATLLGLRRFLEVDVSDSVLLSLAADLGADVPFFLYGGTARGAGRGEEISPLDDLPPVHMVIIFPGIQISTREAYQSLNLELTSPKGDNRIASLCGQLKSGERALAGIFNDFETSILPAYVPVMKAKEFLREHGAMSALLSGSGSSVFGLFSDEESAFAAARAAVREAWRVFPAKTLSRAAYFQQMFG